MNTTTMTPSDAAAMGASVYEQDGAWACSDGHGNEIASGLPSREAAEQRVAAWVRQRPPRPTLLLGRDGIGDGADEDNFQSWVAYVCARIDERCGFEVDVDTRGQRDVQSDDIRGGTDEQREAIADAKRSLWDEWCSDGAPDAQ
jgi:hypothetical protein